MGNNLNWIHAQGLTSDLRLQIARGVIAGVRQVTARGWNADVGDTLEDVSELGVAVTPLPTVNVAMEVVSTSGDDAAAGTGTRTIHIGGLVNSGGVWSEASEEITLNGATPVPTVNSYIRINFMHSGSVGSGGVAAGIISLQTLTSGATEYARVQTGGNQMLQCLYTVPSGCVGIVTEFGAGFGAQGTNNTMRAMLRATVDPEDGALLPGTFLFQDLQMGETASEQHEGIYLKLPAKCDIKVSAQRMNGSNTAQVSASINLLLIDES